MAPLLYAVKLDPFLSLDFAGVEGGDKFCHLATLVVLPVVPSRNLIPLSLSLSLPHPFPFSET